MDQMGYSGEKMGRVVLGSNDLPMNWRIAFLSNLPIGQEFLIMDEINSSHDGLSRREILRKGAGVGAIALAGGSLLTLGGCESASQKRVDRLGGQLGDPIAADPVAVTVKPAPIKTTGGNAWKPALQDLGQIPAFVIARSKWTGGKPRVWLADPMKKVSRITVHHDAISPVPSGSYTDSVRRLSAIRRGHLGNGWADIGYHYAIDPAGRVWEGRPLTLQGAHVKNRNPNNIGVVMFGNYEKIQPTGRAMDALNRLLAHEMGRFGIAISRVHTHRELANTACPGRNLQARMIRTRQAGGELASLLENGHVA